MPTISEALLSGNQKVIKYLRERFDGDITFVYNWNEDNTVIESVKVIVNVETAKADFDISWENMYHVDVYGYCIGSTLDTDYKQSMMIAQKIRNVLADYYWENPTE